MPKKAGISAMADTTIRLLEINPWLPRLMPRASEDMVNRMPIP